ncbi:MAG: 2-C-methyl-D-erythritol 4-phosphate cytidylyltransferase [Desulfuromonas sp.]|nr:MAG: 2-C-methyl-D-erythritol 4-phosphate cytidylyltransferase [Desulfuromonas sp.]
MTVHVLIPAAGSGRRMGTDINKQYLFLGDRPVLAHTLSLFEKHPAIDKITLIVPLQELDFCREEVVERYRFSKVQAVIAGGKERQDSVRNGLQACGADADDVVLIHDGARPLLPPDVVDEAIAAVQRCGAALVAVPAKDTVKEVEDGMVVKTPDRSRLWLAQTPQAFRYQLIASAHEKAYKEAYQATDDAQLVEWLGKPVAIVSGSYCNLKITTPEDLLLAESFLRQVDEEE